MRVCVRERERESNVGASLTLLHPILLATIVARVRGAAIQRRAPGALKNQIKQSINRSFIEQIKTVLTSNVVL